MMKFVFWGKKNHFRIEKESEWVKAKGSMIRQKRLFDNLKKNK